MISQEVDGPAFSTVRCGFVVLSILAIILHISLCASSYIGNRMMPHASFLMLFPFVFTVAGQIIDMVPHLTAMFYEVFPTELNRRMSIFDALAVFFFPFNLFNISVAIYFDIFHRKSRVIKSMMCGAIFCWIVCPIIMALIINLSLEFKIVTLAVALSSVIGSVTFFKYTIEKYGKAVQKKIKNSNDNHTKTVFMENYANNIRSMIVSYHVFVPAFLVFMLLKLHILIPVSYEPYVKFGFDIYMNFFIVVTVSARAITHPIIGALCNFLVKMREKGWELFSECGKNTVAPTIIEQPSNEHIANTPKNFYQETHFKILKQQWEKSVDFQNTASQGKHVGFY